MRRILILGLVLSCLSLPSWSQCADPSACNFGSAPSDPVASDAPCLLLETHQVHTTGPLAGQTTYRLYVHLKEPDHFLSAISTIIDPTLDPDVYPGQTSQIFITTTTSFHQDPLGGPTATGILASLLGFFPDLAYDSWVTIGHAPEDGTAAATVSTINSPSQNWVANFEAGEDLVMNDIIGGLWYILNDGNDQGVPDAEGKVLIAQLTTDGDIGVQLSGQYFPDFGSGPNGEANGADDIQFTAVLGPPCPDDPNAGCTFPEPNLDCDGQCLNDADADGICDEVDPCVGTPDACGVCNGPGAIYECGCSGVPTGDCDCNGNQLDALGICGGPCAADADADGICDDVDPCVGALDACGLCNGPGAIYDCGCTPIPTGDCDCDGNALDAVGECGGPCQEDADGDGLCDDIDPCVGAYDALGTCNGDCTTDADADGVCDDTDPCVGQVDALGICNGDCPSDLDGDGVCDNAEIQGCTDPTSCNFNPQATDEDGSCATLDAVGNCGGTCEEDADADGLCDDVDPCIGAVDSCGVCNGPGAIYDCGCTPIPTGDCDCEGNQLDVVGECGGSCTEDVDADGICDDIDPCIGTIDACGVCNGIGAAFQCGCTNIPEGDCDCNGNQLDILGICGGTCTADADDDGICDDIDPCVGALDSCGVCNGAGAIQTCGCTDIPAGDCDCNGQQLDALGVCGGACSADLDADGVCDDIDPCVGALDACGVCNGPGAVWDCGCTPIPSGDCDCEGQALDALGICGGDCTADADGDGVCDDIDACVGTVDSCGVCNGPGALFECGCSNRPEGDCDCNGNTQDALGICGGTCSADLDGDGVCDDVDDCVGTLDACGVCNGPGPQLDCGCTDIPTGDCDCNGQQLDALGECGGTCLADVNGNGLCDANEPVGCAYPDAENFDPLAAFDDGSCVFELACPEGNCFYDFNGDGGVGATDLLEFLVVFGSECTPQ